LSKVTLNKTIGARKLSKTGVPTSDPEATIPFGAIVERIERDRSRGLVSFRYLTDTYQCAYDTLESAVDGGMDEAGAEASGMEKTSAAAAPAGPRLQFEPVATNMGQAARAKVPGGWIVQAGNGLVFYPDPEHRWV